MNIICIYIQNFNSIGLKVPKVLGQCLPSFRVQIARIVLEYFISLDYVIIRLEIAVFVNLQCAKALVKISKLGKEYLTIGCAGL